MTTFREGMVDGEIDLVGFAEILIKVLPAQQLDAILKEITSRYHRGCCPICGVEEQPVDKKTGTRLAYMDDISRERMRAMDDVEWHDMHEIDCFMTLIEEMKPKKGE